MREVPTVTSLSTNQTSPVISGGVTLNAGESFAVTVNGITYNSGDGNLVVNGDGTSGGASANDTTNTELIVDLTPPPAPGVTSQTTQNTTPTISGTTTNGIGLTLSVEVNSVIYTAGDGNLVDNGNGTWDLTIPAADVLPDGLYQVVASLSDVAGNIANDPGIDDLVVDAIAPPTPGVTSLVTNDTTPIVEGTAVVGAGETLTVEINGVVYTAGDGKLFDNGDGTWSLAIANNLPEANYSVIASVEDIAGNVSTDPSSGELTIDLTAPMAPAVTNLLTNDSTPI